MDKKTHIIQSAFTLFSENGIGDTTVAEIAAHARVSKKTIYFNFRSKDILIRDTFSWKMIGVAKAVDEVIEMNLPAIEKISKYVDVICEKINDISLKTFVDLTNYKSLSKTAANEYLKRAVFIRFNRLLEQVKEEGYIKSGTEVGSALMTYWNILSPYLLMDLSNDVPYELKSAKSLSDILRKQLIQLYRGLLSDQGNSQLNYILRGANQPKA